MFDVTTWVGLVAGCLTAFCTVPQLIQIWKRHCAKDISYTMYFVLSVGVLLWIIYGLLKSDWPIVITNSISLCLNLAMLFSKYFLSRQQKG